MKSRDTLIKLHRFRADEAKAKLAGLEAIRADLERKASELEAHLSEESRRATENEIGRYAYPTFARSIRERKAKIAASVAVIGAFLAETAGEEAVAEFARRQIADLEHRYTADIHALPPHQRVAALSEVLSEDGYAASSSEAPHALGGTQLCQHHCPVAHVAAQFPQLCEAETEAFGRMLGSPVQRLATIAHGDGVCTTHVSPCAPVTKEVPGEGIEKHEESGRTSL
jgi:predicted ArsR family transcriptional regulator